MACQIRNNKGEDNEQGMFWYVFIATPFSRHFLFCRSSREPQETSLNEDLMHAWNDFKSCVKTGCF